MLPGEEQPHPRCPAGLELGPKVVILKKGARSVIMGEGLHFSLPLIPCGGSRPHRRRLLAEAGHGLRRQRGDASPRPEARHAPAPSPPPSACRDSASRK